MTLRIGIVDQGTAYLPEKYAYKSYLENKSISVGFLSTNEVEEASKRFDLLIRFGGLLRRIQSSGPVPEVHEYHSASTGRFPRFRNVVKSGLEVRPVGRIFLNEFVRRQFHFYQRAPWIYRDMGAPDELLRCHGGSRAVYDVVYIGAIAQRPGLLSQLRSLAANGLRIAVAGRATDAERSELAGISGISYVGELERSYIGQLLAEGKAGLNYVPLKYPYIYQTSTKIIEYLVAGLPVISNSYPWIEQHSKQHGYDFIRLERFSRGQFEDSSAKYVLEQPESFTWSAILEAAQFEAFIRRCAAGADS